LAVVAAVLIQVQHLVRLAAQVEVVVQMVQAALVRLGKDLQVVLVAHHQAVAGVVQLRLVVQALPLWRVMAGLD
jgi:hypothetical protein